MFLPLAVAASAEIAAIAAPTITNFALTNAARISTGTGFAGEVITGVQLTTPLPAVAGGGAAVLGVANGDFIGPLIGKSGFRTSAELAEALGTRYQGFVDDAYIAGQRLESRGRLSGNPNTRLGDYVDRISASRLQAYLKSEGVVEGSGKLVEMNRWLRDPAVGSKLYVRPDVRISAAGRIYDATVGYKAYDSTQITRFGQYSNGDLITVVRPKPFGSYSIVPKGN